MNLNNVRLTALLTIIVVFGAWSFFGFWFIGTLILLGIMIILLLWLGRDIDTDTEKEDFRADLIRQALVLKVLANGVRTGTVLGIIVFAILLTVLAASAFHQVKDGDATLLQGIAWWLSGPTLAALVSAFCGFCAGSTYYLLMRWSADLERFSTCNEMQLLHETAKQKKRLTFAH